MGRSFSARLIVPLTVAAALIITGGLLIDYRLSRARILASLDADAEQAMVSSAQRLREMSLGVETALRALAPVVREPLPGEDIDALLAGVVDSNPHIFGAGVALAPRRSPGGRGYAPYLHRNGEARVRRDLAAAVQPYWEAPWFTGARDLGRPLWAEPYFDRGGGEVLMITFALPLFDRAGRFLGVASADVALTELRLYLEPLRIDSAGFGFLLTAGGTLIGAPQGRMIAAPLQQALDLPPGVTPIAWHSREGQDAAQAVDGVVRCPRDPGECRVRLRLAGDTGWATGVVYSEDLLLRPLRDYETRVVTVGAAMLLLLMVAVSMIARRLTRPLVGLARASEAVARGVLDVPLPRASARDEVGQLLSAFDSMRRDLGDYIAQIEQAAALRSRMEGELSAARDIQMAMLPQGGTARVRGTLVDLWARVRPARAVGGDLYSFQRYPDRLLFCVGDVSDKGVPAALFMARAISLIQQWEVQASTAPPHLALRQLNDVLCRDNDSCMFLTLTLGVLDKSTLLLSYASAGHGAPLLLRDGQVSPLQQEAGPALGLREALEFPLNQLQLRRGDRLALHTDGFDEARDGANHMLGEAALRRLLQAQDDLPFDALGEALFAAVDAYTGDARQFDDMTLLLLELRGHRIQPLQAAQAGFVIDEALPAGAQQWFRAQWRVLRLPPAMLPDMLLVLEEIVCNVRDHAAVAPGTSLALSLERYRSRVEIECRDPGVACNPLREARRAELGRETLAAEVGGLGLHLIEALTDAQSYRREDGQNILRVHRRLVAPASPPTRTVAEHAMELDTAVEENRERSLLRVALDGALNTDTAPSLESLLDRAIADDWRVVLLDMRDLDYISSAGLRVIFRAAKQLKGAGRSLAVANRKPQIEKVFEILQALPDMAVFSSEAELDAYLDAMQARAREQGS